MSLSEQFDVGRVLYREEPLALYYLAHDPAEAARAACDYHVRAGWTAALGLLGNAWHRLNPLYLPLARADSAPYGHLFMRRVLPARRPGATLQGPAADPFYEEFLSQSYWLVLGQRIPDPVHTEHPYNTWLAGGTGNYRWVWAWGMALADEHLYRWGRYPTDLPLVWTLEAAPPGLPEAPQTEPVPVGAGDSAVVVDGCYDAVASYRAAYVADKQPILKWTRRALPPWLVRDSSGLFSLYTKD